MRERRAQEGQDAAGRRDILQSVCLGRGIKVGGREGTKEERRTLCLGSITLVYFSLVRTSKSYCSLNAMYMCIISIPPIYIASPSSEI